MTDALISAAEVGQVPASAEPCPDHDTRERPAAVITSAGGGGKISPITEKGPSGAGTPPEPRTPSVQTGRIPTPMMPWASCAMPRGATSTPLTAAQKGGHQ